MTADSNQGWVIARVPSNREFKVHEAVSRPVTGYEWKVDEDEGSPAVRTPVYGSGPACYTPVEMRLAAKNQYTAKKQESRTEIPKAIYAGYLFIKSPEVSLIERLRARGLCYGLIPGVPTRRNGYEPGPLVLSQRAIDHMRAKYGAEYDPATGAGHRTTSRPEAHMQPGYEFEEGDYVMTDHPGWVGHNMLCAEVLDTTARVICRMFGIDHEVTVPLGSVRFSSKGELT